jgi:hypothetical protein
MEEKQATKKSFSIQNCRTTIRFSPAPQLVKELRHLPYSQN